MSRKYAYQVLLIEEFSRNGVEIVFSNAPQAKTPEEQLPLQFQGMIAEYERAQVTERTRRGKRYRAKSGLVNVLCGAPYGYHYIKKTDTSSAYYKIIEEEAEIVKTVYRLYVEDGLSINAIARWLNDKQIPTRKKISLWKRSTIWAMLRNPAHQGTACKIKSFLGQLKSAADTLCVEERQKILCLIVKEILIDDETVIIKHSIPLANKTMAEGSKGGRMCQVIFCVRGVLSPLLSNSRPDGKRRRAESFDFVGFRHFWGKSRKGNRVVQRKTANKKLRQSVRRVHLWCKRNRHEPVKAQWRALCRKVYGHYGYYGVTFNMRGIKGFYEQVKRCWRKWLDRRSRDKHMPWERFNQLLERYPLLAPRIVHKFS